MPPFELPPPPATQLVDSWQWRDWFFRLRQAILTLDDSGGPGQGLITGSDGTLQWVTIYYTQAFTAQTSITVTHNMNITPHVQVYTSAAEMIIPKRIKHLTVDVFVVNFSIPTSGTIIAIR